MKQCPACKREYKNDKQKFCTQDGTPLVDAHAAKSGQGATVLMDSAELDDEVTKAISQGLPRMADGGFDPYKTTVSTPQPGPDMQAASQPSPPSVPAAPPADVATAQPVASPPPPAAPPPPIAPPVASQVVPTQSAGQGKTVVPIPEPAPIPAAVSRPPKKRSKLPVILAVLVVLLFLGAGGVVAGYFFVLKPMLDAKRGQLLEPRRPQPTPAVVTTPKTGTTKPEISKVEVPPYSPPADAVQFVNSSANLTGKLAEHYVDFSFYYPSSWHKDPSAGVPGANNFARVERSLPPNFTQESFAVGWYASAGSEEGDQAAFHTLAETMSSQYAQNPDFKGYRKVSEGPVKVGAYDGYEFRFETDPRSTAKGDIEIWGRVVFVPPVDGGQNGVTLLMLTTSLAPELKSVDDVGVKGGLPMLLQSFRFGK